MADFIQAVKWKQENKLVLKKSYNGLLTNSLTCIEFIDSSMGKTLETQDYLDTDWEIYEEKDDWNIKKQLSLGETHSLWGLETKSQLEKLKQKIVRDLDDVTRLQQNELEEIQEIINKRFGF